MSQAGDEREDDGDAGDHRGHQRAIERGQAGDVFPLNQAVGKVSGGGGELQRAVRLFVKLVVPAESREQRIRDGIFALAVGINVAPG